MDTRTKLHPEGRLDENLYPDIITDNIPDKGVTSEKIADNAITNEKLALNSIRKENIQPKAIVNENIDDKTIKGGKLADRTIIAQKIASLTITGNEIADSAIGKRKLDDETIAIINASDKLSRAVTADANGNAQIGKNLEIDGNVLTLNGKQWGIVPIYYVDSSESINTSVGFMLCAVMPTLTNNTLIINGGIYIAESDEENLLLCPDSGQIDLQDTIDSKLENDVLYLGDPDIDNFLELFSLPITHNNLESFGASYFQRKLYRHSITCKSNYDGGNLWFFATFDSTSNLVIDSLQDLTTVLKPTNGYWISGSPSPYDTNGDTKWKGYGKLHYLNNIWYLGGSFDMSNLPVISVEDEVVAL